MSEPELKSIPRPEQVAEEIERHSENLKKLRRQLRVSEDTYGALPKAPATEEKAEDKAAE
jgi:hypothetical protein